jgi:hypothetical protein
VRQIFAFIMTTLDGYYEGPNQEFDFWVVDEEFNGFAVEQLDEVDTLGRRPQGRRTTRGSRRG